MNKQQQQVGKWELLHQLKLAREKLSDLAWDLEEIEIRLQQLEQQLQEDGANDLMVTREVELLRQRRSQQEELVLQQMLQIDELNRMVAEDS